MGGDYKNTFENCKAIQTRNYEMIVKNVFDPSLIYLSEKFDVDETLLLDMSVVVEDEDGCIAWLIECPDVLQAYSNTNGFDFFKTMHHRLETKTNKFKTLITSNPSFATRAKRAMGLSSEFDVLTSGVSASLGRPFTADNLLNSMTSALSIS